MTGLPPAGDVRRAVAAVEPELRSLLQRLVRAASLPDQEEEAQRLVAEQLTDLGLKVTIQPVRFDEIRSHPAFAEDGFSADGRSNVVGIWQAGGRADHGRSLVLNGHVDVVPPGPLERWSRPPFSGEIEGTRLHGRGACDMKAGLVAAIGAVAALRRLGYQPAAPVTLHSVVGEETGGLGTLAAIVAGYTADAAIVLEPTSLRACPVQAGATMFRLTVLGRATHAATRRAGVSALEKFVGLLAALPGFEERRQRQVAPEVAGLFDDPNGIAPLSVGTVNCGDWPSSVPDRLVAEGRLGILPGEAVGQARDAFERAIAAAAASDEWLSEHAPLVEWFEAPYESGETPLDAPFLRLVAQAHEDMLDGVPAVAGVPYGSDLRLFTNHAGMPAVLYGPGDVRLAHAIDEWVDLDEMRTAAEVTARLITLWCGTAG